MADKRPRCPQCGDPIHDPRGNQSRPFCSPRCQMLDLSKWLGEEYRIPGEAAQVPEPNRQD